MTQYVGDLHSGDQIAFVMSLLPFLVLIAVLMGSRVEHAVRRNRSVRPNR